MLQKPAAEDYLPAIKLTVFIFIFSIAVAYMLFYPLSLIHPEFVTYWLIDIPPIIYSHDQQFPILANVLIFIPLVILAPVIEELAFRGILLHRWSQKWGSNKAIIFSSLLFGIAHTDPLGASAFGAAMCIIYLKTQSLLVPMLCHALNNLVGWLMSAGYIAYLGSGYVYTLEDFQSEWLEGIIAALITGIWIYIYLHGENGTQRWSLPRI